jgi:2'-5' RNA ligase
MKMIRAFIAIPLPPAVTTLLEKTGQSLAGQLPANRVRWVKPEAMHLTLRFLGDTAENQLPALKRGLDGVCGRYGPFELQLGELGCFPNGRRPRVIWAGIRDLTAEGAEDAEKRTRRQGDKERGTQEEEAGSRTRGLGDGRRGTHELNVVQRLAGEIEEMVVGLGWQKEERGFRPHLTIGRVREGQRLPEMVWGQQLEPLVIPVTAVHLIESELRPMGPVYTTLHSSRLLRK